jgi:selenocysteine lyase/cysteine desulfurase
VPRRLDFVRFRIGDGDLEAAFGIAHELAERATRALDEAARTAGARILGAGASRPIVLSSSEQAALARVIDAWSDEPVSLVRLRKRLPE